MANRNPPLPKNFREISHMNKGILFTALSALLYGSIGYFGVRLLDLGLSVNHMLFWRFSCASLMLPPLLLLRRCRQKHYSDKKAMLSLFLLGGLCQGVSTACYFEASRSIGTGLAMVLFFTYPIFVVALSFFLKKTPLRRPTAISLLLIMVGCALIAAGGDLTVNFDGRGFLLSLISGLCYAVYIFYSKEMSGTLSPPLATLSVCAGIACAFALYSLFGAQMLYWPQGHEIWLLIALFALIGTVLPVLLLLAGMSYLSANTVSIISVLEPIAVLGVGAFLLNEQLGATQLAGALIIMSATILVYCEPKTLSS